MNVSITRIVASVSLTLFFLSGPSIAAPAGEAGISKLSVEFEAGSVWLGRNDVEIPNDGTATRFSVEELIGRGPFFSCRVYVSYDFNEKHGLRLLFAPLTVEGNGTPAAEIKFDDQTFEAGVPTEAKYRFNSYRLTYRYLFFDGDRFRCHVGFTAKIRDAEVALSQGSKSAS